MVVYNQSEDLNENINIILLVPTDDCLNILAILDLPIQIFLQLVLIENNLTRTYNAKCFDRRFVKYRHYRKTLNVTITK